MTEEIRLAGLINLNWENHEIRNQIPLTSAEQDLYASLGSEQLKSLIYWYICSKEEASLGGTTCQEVGKARENDLIAYLVHMFGNRVSYQIGKHKKEDVILDTTPISIKHSENRNNVGNGIKAVWTANEQKQQEEIANHQFICNLLIVYINWWNENSEGQIRIFYIPKEVLRKLALVYQIQGKPILKPLSQNSRGIEFQPDFFNKLIENYAFKVYVTFKCLCKELFCLDPIKKRLLEAKSFFQEHGF